MRTPSPLYAFDLRYFPNRLPQDRPEPHLPLVFHSELSITELLYDVFSCPVFFQLFLFLVYDVPRLF